MTVSDSGHDFSALKVAGCHVLAVGSMSCEALAEAAASVIINFAEELRPLFIVSAVCLKDVSQPF